MSTPIISIQNASKNYGKYTVFRNLSLTFDYGKISVIFGQSGLGKTTLLKCISLLESLDNGSIEIESRKVVDNGVILDEAFARKKIGIVFQDLYLWDNKTVLENITESLVYAHKVHLKNAKEKAISVAEELHVDAELLRKYPPELSRGQRQRVAIARCLVLQPSIIFFDEPTASLDEELVDHVVSVLRGLQQRGKTVIVVTHDMRFARAVGDVLLNFRDFLSVKA